MLLGALASSSGWTVAGPAVDWFYDPPWTLAMLRRNEVAVPVRRASP
jgi:SOUL heme-binding protein